MQAQDIPYGYCQCGCGEKTALATKRRDDRQVGEPARFISGHNARLQHGSAEVRFWRSVDKHGAIPPHCPSLGACWVWMASRGEYGYARFYVFGKRVQVHRWIWPRLNGPLPAGLEMDHLCHNPTCVNPAHLDAVTHTENNRRKRTTKLTAEAARAIRRSSLTDPQLAAIYGVGRCTVTDVRTGRTWRDV